MSKIIISGSIAFQKDFEELTNTLTENGHQVINYPKATDDLSTQFPTLFVDFYKDIEKAEIFYLYNKEKKWHLWLYRCSWLCGSNLCFDSKTTVRTENSIVFA